MRAIIVGSVVFVPAAFLTLLFVLPAVAWLALVGLVVPVLVLERPGTEAAFRRAIQLARADFVHALGSLATLAILFGLVKLTLVLLLHDLGDAGERVALGLGDLVMSPLLFLGGRSALRRPGGERLEHEIQKELSKKNQKEITRINNRHIT